MSFRTTGGLLVALAAWPHGVFAQDWRALEVGGFLQWTAFDNSLRVDDFFAIGGHVSLPLKGAVGVEADIAHTSTNGPPGFEVTYLPIHARLTYTKAVRGRTAAVLGAGYAHNRYGASREGSDHGVNGLVGLRFGLPANLSARFDVLVDYMPAPVNRSLNIGENWNVGVRQGLSYAFGRTRETPMIPSPEPRGEEIVMAEVERTTITRDPDEDGDGVGDARDRCARTPAGMAVDAAGCPLDTDADGVPDRIDRCANTTNTTVDASGCPLDSDGDSVTDMLDRCAGTPSGTRVDANGCALDSDHDGVPDATDRCPGTTAGTAVDATGCLRMFEENKTSLILRGVNFANGQSVLTEESKAVLDNVAASLAAHAGVRVRVEGHTSTTGGRALNVRLSQSRAEAVKAYLVSRGVAETRLTAEGLGPSRPIASNTTAHGQAQNRRVELVKLD